MKCLIIIDMQEDYVGDSRNIKIYPYKAKELIDSFGKLGESPKS